MAALASNHHRPELPNPADGNASNPRVGSRTTPTQSARARRLTGRQKYSNPSGLGLHFHSVLSRQRYSKSGDMAPIANAHTGMRPRRTTGQNGSMAAGWARGDGTG